LSSEKAESLHFGVAFFMLVQKTRCFSRFPLAPKDLSQVMNGSPMIGILFQDCSQLGLSGLEFPSLRKAPRQFEADDPVVRSLVQSHLKASNGRFMPIRGVFVFECNQPLE
jgi:hypothetical protein